MRLDMKSSPVDWVVGGHPPGEEGQHGTSGNQASRSHGVAAPLLTRATVGFSGRVSGDKFSRVLKLFKAAIVSQPLEARPLPRPFTTDGRAGRFSIA